MEVRSIAEALSNAVEQLPESVHRARRGLVVGRSLAHRFLIAERAADRPLGGLALDEMGVGGADAVQAVSREADDDLTTIWRRSKKSRLRRTNPSASSDCIIRVTVAAVTPSLFRTSLWKSG